MTDFARLVLDADTRGLKDAERDLKGVDAQAMRTARDVDTASGKMVGAFKRIGGALVAAGITTVLFQFGKLSAQAAIDAEEMDSAFGVVFGNMADDVREWARVTGDALGRSTQEIQRGALAFQELFGKALQPEKAAEMSKQFAVLTQDLASFKNLSNEVAQQKLFSGLIGEAEPLRAVGVFLDEAALKAKAAALGMGDFSKELTSQEKIIVRAAVINEQLAAAQGDVERTSGSTANQIKTYQAAVEELQVAIGQKLLPTLTPLISGSAQIVTAFAEVARTGVVAGVSISEIARVVITAGSAWAAYRITLLAAQGATLLMNSTLAFNASVLLATGRTLGTVAAAQTALGVATSATTGIFRALTAALIANPFTAVAVAVGALTAAFVGMGQAQASARAETDNLVRSLRGLAQARSADFAVRRAEVDVERRRLETRLAGIRAEQSSVRNSPELAQRGTANSRFKALDDEARALTWQIVEMEGELSAADRALVSANKAAESMVVPVAQAGGAVAGLSKELRGAGDSAKKAGDEFASLYDRLFPIEAAMRQLDADRALILSNKNLTAARKEELLAALEQERFRNGTRGLGAAEVSRNITGQGPLANPVSKAAQQILDDMEKVAKGTKGQANTITETFAQMTQKITASLQGLANNIRSGDFLGILGGVLNIFTQLGSAGVFGSGLQANLNRPVAPAPSPSGLRSFSGGGYTGSGARSGGLDGKGGFLAMMHPRETVIDHTRSHRPANDVNITVGIDPANGNITAFVNGQIAATAPAIAGAGAAMAQGQMAQRARRRVR